MLISRCVVCVPGPENAHHALVLCPADIRWGWCYLGLSWLVLLVGSLALALRLPGANGMPGTGGLRTAPRPAFGALGDPLCLCIVQIGKGLGTASEHPAIAGQTLL